LGEREGEQTSLRMEKEGDHMKEKETRQEIPRKRRRPDKRK
jgi:hypothetical protein